MKGSYSLHKMLFISQRNFASSLPARNAEKDYYSILGIETFSTPE
jgi:hypothetical protein